MLNQEKTDRADQFVRLFSRDEPRLHAYILTMVPSWSDAADILQETSAILWKKFDEFETDSNFFAWACQIARFEVSSHRRRNRKLQGQLSDEFVNVVAARAEQLTDQLESRRELLAGCLEKLRSTDRDLLLQRYLDGSSVEAAAERTGRTVAAIYKSLQRIRKQLLDCVESASLAGGGP